MEKKTLLGGMVLGAGLMVGLTYAKNHFFGGPTKPAAAIVAAQDNAIQTPEDDPGSYVPVFGTCEKVDQAWLNGLAGSLDGRKAEDNAVGDYTQTADGSVLEKTLLAAMSCHVNGKRVDKPGKTAGKLDFTECRKVATACTRPAPQAAQ